MFKIYLYKNQKFCCKTVEKLDKNLTKKTLAAIK
jgi:hypothetical protein